MPSKKNTIAPNRSKQYKFAPIREAVIEILVNPAADFNPERLREVFAGMAAEAKPLHEATGEFAVGSKVSATAHQHHVGYVVSTPNYFYQARVNGFAISKLGAYSNWNDFKKEANRCWNAYQQVRKQASIQRVGLRYINRVDIPASIASLSEYLTTFPKLSEQIEELPSEFFFRFELPVPSIQGKAIINEALVEKGEGTISIILDIDVFRDAPIPEDEKGIWALLDRLRKEKNRIFESCITDKSRYIFNHVNPNIGLSSVATASVRGGKQLPSGKRRGAKT